MPKNNEHISVFWFRRDLRIDDNAGLYNALKSGYRVLPLFIFDTNILDRLEERRDRRIEFIAGALGKMQESFTLAGSSLAVYNASPVDAFSKLLTEYNVKAVYANHDYEPYAVSRDTAVGEFLKESGIPFHTFKDQVIFEKNEVLKSDGTPYTVFTPYANAWKKLFYKRGCITLSVTGPHR